MRLSNRKAQGAAADPARVDSAVGRTDVPEDVLALSSLPDADYVDVFTVFTDVEATPERWARAMFGDVPSAAEQLIWRGLLGMRLSRGRSPDTIAGWQIAEGGENWLRLEAGSWFLTGNLVVQVTDESTSLATFVRYERSLGRLIWPPLSVIHRRLAPSLLRDATIAHDRRKLTNQDARAGRSAQSTSHAPV